MPDGSPTSLVVWLVNQGVAVAVAAFVLWRVEKRLVELDGAIDSLVVTLIRTGAINGKTGATVQMASSSPPEQAAR